MHASTIAQEARGGMLSWLGFAVLAALSSAGCTVVTYQPEPAAVPQNEYYDEYAEPIDDVDYLSQYGDWVVVAGFGTVWRPVVIGNWGPFWHGHWIWTHYGWSWVSYEPFGWLVYHYGYWYYEPVYGWFWVPGDTWSPARVQWYTFGDYCAWAPLPPRHHAWPDPWGHRGHVNAWVVVESRHFTHDDVIRYRSTRPVTRENIAPGRVVKQAPDVRHIESVTRSTVPRVKIEKQDVEVHANKTAASQRYAPPKTSKLERMVLPQQERGRVEKHRSEVEREVLGPKKAAPPPEKPKEPKSSPKSKTTRTKKGAD